MKTLTALGFPICALMLAACSPTTFAQMPNQTSAQSVSGDPGPTPITTPTSTPTPSPTSTPASTATPAPTLTPAPVATATPEPAASPTPASPTAPCVPVADVTRLTKILFLVDTSGSNSEWVNSTGDAVCSSSSHKNCLPPTDPTKAFRLGSIRKFVTKYGGMQNLEWGFVTFSNENSIDYIQNSSGPSFTSSTSVMQQALDKFSTEVDYADTPYGLALNDAKSTISNDTDHNTTANPQYYVILLSDGFPTDLKTQKAAAAKVAQVLKAAPGEVTLSTIFYGNQSKAASQSAMNLLSSMAKAGNGQFANVNDPASGIDIENVLPGHACQN